MPMNKISYSFLGIIIFLLFVIFSLAISDSDRPSYINLVKLTSPDWTIKIEKNDKNDDCALVRLNYLGKNEYDSLSEYIDQVVYAGTGVNWEDSELYLPNSDNVIEVSGQGVGNFNTLYVLSTEDDLYTIEVNSVEPKYDPGTLSSCEQPIQLVYAIIDLLH